MSKPIRALIADDHMIVRSGVRLLLQAEPDIEVVGEAIDGQGTLTLVEKLQPDVVLLDIGLPDMNGLEVARQIKASFPEIAILVLTVHRSDEYFFEMLRIGASGYLLKGAEANELIHAVRVVAGGEVYLYPTLTHKLVEDFLGRQKGEAEQGPGLSAREQEILSLLADGYTTREIAEKLVITPSTIYTHRSKLMDKLGLTSRHELMQYARRHGLIRDT